jgi:hypothetical protein
VIVQNMALRLHKAPKDSQLLRRVGGAWHTPTLEDFPLPAPARYGAKTTLRTHPARVLPMGPCINSSPEIPAGALHWNGQLRSGTMIRSLTRSQPPVEKARQSTSSATVSCPTRTAQTKTTRSRLGRSLPRGKGDRSPRESLRRNITITKSDTLICSLPPALDLLTSYLASRPVHAHPLVITTTPSAIALDRAPDASPHDEQSVALGELLTSSPRINITLQWLPRNVPFVGFQRARQLVFEAIRTADLSAIEEPQSIQQQRQW